MIKPLSITARHIWWYYAQLFCLLGCHGAWFGRQLTMFWVQPVGHIFLTAWPLKTELVDCPTASVTNYQSVLRNITGDRWFHFTMVEAWNHAYLSAICWKIRSLSVLLMEMFCAVYSRICWTLCYYYKSHSGW